MAGPAPTTLQDNRDRSAGPVHSSGWLSSGLAAISLLRAASRRHMRAVILTQPPTSRAMWPRSLERAARLGTRPAFQSADHAQNVRTANREVSTQSGPSGR